MDIRKYGIMFAVAILTAIFVYAVADAIAPQVDYESCYEKNSYPGRVAEPRDCTAVPVDQVAQQACIDAGNMYEARYDAYGCVESYTCSTCYREQQEQQEQHNMVVFYTAIVLGLIAIVVGFMLPVGSIHEWVGIGFIIGGVISLFIGTAQYWGDLSRYIRPVVIALELGVVLFIVYRKMRSEATEETPVAGKRVTRKKK